MRERFADRVHPWRVEPSDGLGQERLRNGPEVVQAYGALDRHAVFGSKLDLRIDPTDRPRHERDNDVAQPWEGFVTGEDNNRAATVVLELEPYNLAARYQRSSRIASRAFVSAQTSSTASTSSEAAHRRSRSRSRINHASAASASASLSSSTSRCSLSREVIPHQI